MSWSFTGSCTVGPQQCTADHCPGAFTGADTEDGQVLSCDASHQDVGVCLFALICVVGADQTRQD